MIPIHPRIDRLQPYVAGIRPEPGTKAIKLNQNESPYPASPKVTDALRRLDPELLLREYPDSGCSSLREALSAVHGVPASMILCGNGSSELITLLYKTFLCEGDTVAIPDPSFGLYTTVAEMAGVRVASVPTDDDFRIAPEKLTESAPQAIVIANPNAPTGLHLEAAQIERLLQSYRGLVVVDEAYIDFAPEGVSVLKLTERYDHLLVLRTFSKAYALSGGRIGFAVANERLIRAMEKARETFSVGAVAQLAAEAALSDQDYMRETVTRIGRTRERFCEALARIGWTVYPSVTNFVLISPPREGRTAKELYERLLSEHIYVRYFDIPRLADKLRISIGTDEEMKVVLDSLARAD
ncbi:histidinol-phosphate transaminase [Paenibacillus mesophilus]|uniref:histidinol-phosphate transaminase n=1 Tax=Paenibacillus mesophilus TaxID=2582849 RepID=UPI00110E93BC|nr:histidinol-phosphate transaminase [Paenibacillus mesophilus]TMV49450.1 histidinol-phosphate transaminase [Paenibacillus mesophilus]